MAAFSLTTDATYSETGSFDVFGGHVGYFFHDYGASVFSVQPTYSWTGEDPSSLRTAGFWMGSAGAVTLGASVGSRSVFGSNTITVPLTAPVSSGRHLLIMVCMATDFAITSVPPVSDISITDTVGGNSIQYGSFPDIGFAYVGGNLDTGGAETWGDFYKINNPLSAGDEVTITISSSLATCSNLQARLHVLNGVNLSDPSGPRSGGNLIGYGDNEGVESSPFTRASPPVPNWVGGTLVMALKDEPTVPRAVSLDKIQFRPRVTGP